MLRRHFLGGLVPMLSVRTETSQQPLRALEPLVGPVIDRVASDDEFRRAFIELAHRRLGTSGFSEAISELLDDAQRVVGPSVTGPVIDRIADDVEFRKEFVNYARERLGPAKFNAMLYSLMLDAKPELRGRPLLLRMMWRVISGSRRRLFGRC